ncbi:hypothetical protein [Mycolicibacterium neoaurum]|uniref:hypothetical protein n=1 Tax=Mycolicibacterium neoaurum TaxID=1795 RepID=UPI001F4CA76E|nr:hypothetical protein [Mycolicibacterium neoaurum]
MPELRPRFDTPLQELIETAGQLDADEQLDLHSPQEHIAAQDGEYVAALGVMALTRAQEWLNVAYLCRDQLVDEGLVEKSRKRVVDLAQAVPELGALNG